MIDPEVLRAILQGGAQSGQLDPDIERMQDQITQLRGQEKPGMINAGKMMVAPSWLSVLGQGLNGYMQAKAGNQMYGMKKQQAGIRSDQNSRLLDALMQQQQQQQGDFGQGPTQGDMDPYQRFRIGGNT